METDEGLRHLLQEIARVEPAQAQAGVGDVLGRYQLVRELGRGGFGVVFAARDPELGREVALKIMRPRDHSDEKLRQQFHLEAAIVARLKHPHIVTLYDWSSDPPYLVLELLTGETLEQRLKRGPLPFDEALDLALAVAGALAHAHKSGAVHRDLKPSNVFLCSDGVPKILDFGLAHDGSGAGLLQGAGTPSYMAPEQRAQHSGDARSDVWAFGAVLQEMLTGRRLDGERPSSPLAPVIARALEAEPGDRYADGGALLVELTGVRARLRAAALDRRRRRLLLGTAAGVALTLAAGVMTMQVITASRVRAAAEAAAEVNRIEAELRFAHLAPRHDLRGDEERARRELGELEKRLEGRGRFAHSRGELALGRGLLALGDSASAIRHLRSISQDDGEVRQALGEALGAEWERRAQQAELIRDDDERRARLEQLERDLRQPAAQLLEASHASSALTLARLALLHHDQQQALSLAEKAAAEAPWLYEADLIASRVHEGAAQAAFHAGRFAEALPLLDQAEAASQRALAMGRSDPEVAGDGCARAILRVEIGNESSHHSDADDGAARDACQRAIEIAPDRFRQLAITLRLDEVEQVHGDRNKMRTFYAEAQALASTPALSLMVSSHQALRMQNLGDDVLPLIERSLPDAETLLLQNSDEPNTNLLADLLFSKIRAEIDRGIDPTSSCVRMEKLLANAHLPRPLSRLARVETMRGEWEASHDIEPGPSWQRAIDAYQAVLVHEPGNAKMLDEISAVYYDQALHAQAVGKDGNDAFRRSVELSERGLGLRPDHPVALANLGVTLGDWAQSEMKWGRDPGKALDRAREVLTRSSQLESGAPDTWYTLAIEERARAEWLLESGRDPSAALTAARVAARKAIALSPKNLALLQADGDVDRVLARAEAQHGRSPLALLASAQAEYEKARAVDGENTMLVLAVADIMLSRLDWTSAHGAPSPAELSAARALLLPLVAAPRPLLDAFRLQARALTLAARLEKDPAQKRELAGQAKLALSHVTWPSVRDQAQAELDRLTAAR